MARSQQFFAAIVAAASGLALVAGSASAQVFAASPGLRIPATGTGGTADAFITSTINVPLFASINDINIVVNITHTFVGDLDIFLVPPGGSSYLKLTSDNGGNGDNYTFTRFDDLATASITSGVAPFNSNFDPEGGAFNAGDPWSNTGFTLPPAARPSLATFNGAPTNGAWTLVIGDDVSDDIGTLNYWSIEFNRTFDPQGPTPLEGSVNSFATLALSQSSGRRAQSFFDAFLTVTPATNPPSTGITAFIDAESLDSGFPDLRDDGSYPDMVAGDNIFSGRVDVGFFAVPGPRTLIARVNDLQNRVAFATAPFTVLPATVDWDETINGGGDAGDRASTAQAVVGSGFFESIGGTINGATDADLYTIGVCDLTFFEATTFSPDTALDTQLFLFNTDGTGVSFNDDVPDGFEGDASLQSRITGQFAPGTGNYILGVALYDNDPFDSSALPLWLDNPVNTERAPDASGAASPVANWAGGTITSGSYRVNLSGACFPGAANLCNYDYNQDENVDLTDAQLMAQVAAGIIAQDSSWLSGDMNGDENADLTDAQQLAAFVASGVCPI